MKKFFTNKIMQFVLAFAIVLTSMTFMAGTESVEAASSATVFFSSDRCYTEYASQDGQIYYYNVFTVTIDKNCLTQFYINTGYSSKSFAVGVYNLDGSYVTGTGTLETTENADRKYDYTTGLLVPAGTYYIKYDFSGSGSYSTEIFRDALQVTAGFKLNLGKYIQDCQWTSSNKKAVAVNGNGVVKAKKKGKATVTCTMMDGQTYDFDIKVVPNQFKSGKIKVNDCWKLSGKVVKMNYDKKGNLKVKVMFANPSSSSHRVESINFTIKNEKGKVIGKYNAKTSVTVGGRKTKSVTYTIAKSKLKIKKKQDLVYSYCEDLGGKFY